MADKFKRAPNGCGTVTKASGARRKPWVARAPGIETEDGFKRDVIGYFATKQEAYDALAAYKITPRSAKAEMTLEEIYKEWSSVAFRGLSKSTIDNYKASWKYLEPLKAIRIAELRSADFQHIIDDALNKGKSISTAEKIKALSTSLEDYSIQNDIINKNYASFVKLPKREDIEKAVFSETELQKISAAAQNGVGIADLILILCYTGWRIQEFCNLTVFSYNDVNKTLTGGLKTDAGKNRVVPVPEKVIPLVRKYASRNGDRLFCYEYDGRFIGYNSKKLRAEFYSTLDALGIQDIDAEPKRLTPHSTRHTYNSMLNKSGVSVSTRMKLLGQVSEKTNIRTYTHTDLEQLRAAVNMI